MSDKLIVNLLIIIVSSVNKKYSFKLGSNCYYRLFCSSGSKLDPNFFIIIFLEYRIVTISTDIIIFIFRFLLAPLTPVKLMWPGPQKILMKPAWAKVCLSPFWPTTPKLWLASLIFWTVIKAHPSMLIWSWIPRVPFVTNRLEMAKLPLMLKKL